MKSIYLILFTFLLVSAADPIQWTDQELNSANTASDVSYLDEIEKEAIQYLNLARMYPKKFLKIELNNYKGPEGYREINKNDSYRKSLERTLKKLKPLPPVQSDSSLYATATCLVKEQGRTRRTGHTRIRCKKDYYGECISYGMQSGKEIIMQLLIDKGVPNLGHRKICLHKEFNLIGIKHGSHKRYETMSVLDFK
jgi:uncharacterized protein YkwD